MKKKALITGIAGFLGRTLAQHLMEKGWVIRGVDRHSAENVGIYGIQSYACGELQCVDLAELLQEKPEMIIHCAGRSSVPNSFVDLENDYENGPSATFRILNGIRQYSPQSRFIFLSSAAVYGNPGSLPVREDAPLKPISPYGFHKVQSESLCSEFYKSFGIRTAIVRIFSAYGQGLCRQVFWDICQKISREPQVILHGTGRESRDFIHALDVARSIEILTESGEFNGDVYNLATGVETSIEWLASKFCRHLDRHAQIAFDGNLPDGIPSRWRADVQKIMGLGFRPIIKLEDGIEAYAKWFKQNQCVK